MRLPDFLIVGAMKAGSSTLAEYLNMHTDIHMPDHEMHFFNRDINFEQGVGYYSQELMKGAGDSILCVGEKTPTYSCQENCAERIYEALPNVKLVWILREPFSRSFSNFMHAKNGGVETRDFQVAVMEESESIKENIFKGYVERSKYINQIERFLEFFSIEQMYFLKFENLVSDYLRELNLLAEFLGVAPFKGNLSPVHRNKTRLKAGEPCQVASELREKLKKQFEPSNEKLTELTGLDLSDW